MIANKRASPTDSPELVGETDLARVDAHVIQPHEYEEIPELTDDWFAMADRHVAEVLVRRGRPKLARPKRQVTMRLDADLLDGLRATGPGWQGRVNAALRDWLRTRETV